MHDILLLIACAQMLQINAYVGVFSKAKGLNFGQGLHQHPYFVYMSSEGAGESTHLRRLALALAAQ